MNPEVKKQWIEALRSGEYKQCASSLKLTDSKATSRYCCLGVLCDLHSKATNTPWDEDVYLYHRADLPDAVLEWSGLIQYGSSVGFADEASLITLNDSGNPFTEIADVIEQKL
jgi:hypothetical protein